METKLFVSSSPHLRSPRTVRGIMLDVILALVPACVASAVIFGYRVIGVIASSVVAAVVSEALYEKAVKREVTVNDLSAVVTGLLLALTLPPGVPLFIPVIGSVFAIVVAKQIFGGLGTNFVNPALAGRAFVFAAWPLHMTRDWVQPVIHDATTAATPLAVLKGTGSGTIPGFWDLFLGWRLGCIGETSVAALLLGGLYLVARGVIDLRIPLGFIVSLALGSWVFAGKQGFFTGDPVTAVLLGGVFLGAFFMATDYVTSPVTPRGRLYMGIGCGIVTLLIRQWGAYPEGVTYAILFMNLMTPLIDRYVVPRYYGYAHDAALRKRARAGR